MTTRPDRPAGRAPDLVERDFHAEAPNRLWAVDFTYVPAWTGMVFTAFVCDVYSRRIVGWRTASAMPTELPLDALEMALWTRQRAGHSDGGRLAGLVHHSDAGSQYTAIRYGSRLAEAGALASIGSVGDSYDCEHRGVAAARGLTLVMTGPAGAFALTCRPRVAATLRPLAGWAVTS